MEESERIIVACIKGDNGAEKALFSLFLPKVLGICRRYALNEADADDLAQETFIKVFTRLKQYDLNRGKPSHWISRICVNTCLVYLRNARKYLQYDDMPSESHDEDEVKYVVDKEKLLQCIRDLPTGYKTVLNLYVFDEWSHKQIAIHLGITESSSRSQLSRAKSSLKKTLNTTLTKKYEKGLV